MLYQLPMENAQKEQNNKMLHVSQLHMVESNTPWILFCWGMENIPRNGSVHIAERLRAYRASALAAHRLRGGVRAVRTHSPSRSYCQSEPFGLMQEPSGTPRDIQFTTDEH